MTATHAEALRAKGTGVYDLKCIPFGEKKKKMALLARQSMEGSKKT